MVCDGQWSHVMKGPGQEPGFTEHQKVEILQLVNGRLLPETDSPYMTPQGADMCLDSRRYSPLYLGLVTRLDGEMRRGGVSPDAILEVTHNARTLDRKGHVGCRNDIHLIQEGYCEDLGYGGYLPDVGGILLRGPFHKYVSHLHKSTTKRHKMMKFGTDCL